ncbi:hypothetical protein FXO37_06519, partial [Capsicum annuum]
IEETPNHGDNNPAWNDIVVLIEKSKKRGMSIREDMKEGPEYTHKQMTEQIVTQRLVPYEDQFPEGIPVVQSLNSTPYNKLDSPSTYKLPFRHNRGQPPNR